MKTKTILPLIALALCSCGGATGNSAKISEEKAFNECVRTTFLIASKSHLELTYEPSNKQSIPVGAYDYGWRWTLLRYDENGEPFIPTIEFNMWCNVDSVGVTFIYGLTDNLYYVIWAR